MLLLLQVSAIKQGIAELRAGLKKAEAEINMAADLVGADEGAALMAQFANMMAAFHTSAAAAVARTEVWLPVPRMAKLIYRNCRVLDAQMIPFPLTAQLTHHLAPPDAVLQFCQWSASYTIGQTAPCLHTDRNRAFPEKIYKHRLHVDSHVYLAYRCAGA